MMDWQEQRVRRTLRPGKLGLLSALSLRRRATYLKPIVGFDRSHPHLGHGVLGLRGQIRFSQGEKMSWGLGLLLMLSKLGCRGPAISSATKASGSAVDLRIAQELFSLRSVKHLVGNIPRPAVSHHSYLYQPLIDSQF